MNLFIQFLAKFVRRKTAFWGLITGLLIFLLCAYSANYNKHPSSFREPSEPVVGLHKRLQTIDNGLEPVQFVPGVPGHNARFAAPNKAPNHSEMEVDKVAFFKEEAEKHNPHAYHVRNKGVEYRGDGENKPLQIMEQGREANVPQVIGMDENVEFRNPNSLYSNQNDMGNAVHLGQMDSRLGAPVYYNQGMGNNDFIHQGFPLENSTPDPKPYVAKNRLVHFDLKGAPPTVAYLKKILPTLKQQGATGILWEWEDTFPFSGRLASVATSNHYTVDDVQELLALCNELGLESIPLVQTFGHMEFILKLEQFKHLRDNENMPESICPCHEETMPLITDMISQVMKQHKNARYLHIGCDEVYHLGTCPPCMDQPRNKIFVNHVTRLASHVKSNYGVQPIIWDDMLRNFMEDEMMPLAEVVEPMVWVYAEDVYRFMPSFTWDRFASVFPYIWTASAFKGAHGETLVVPDAKRHLVNNLNWINVMKEQESKLKGGFKGIVITGWQRFDHFAVLCELLPAGLPSLFLDLQTVSHGYFNQSLVPDFLQSLNCPRTTDQVLNLDSDNFLFNALSWCYFPGSNFFRITEKLIMLEHEVEDFFKKVEKKKGWFTQYNRDHHFGSSFRIDEVMEDWSRFQHETASLMKAAKNALAEVFDYHTQGEWVEQKLYPIYRKLSQLRQEADDLKEEKVWQKRPFPIAKSLLGMGIGVPPTTPPPPPPPSQPTQRPKRRVQSPDLYSSKGRLKALGHR